MYPLLKKAASPCGLVKEESTKLAARFYNHKGFVLRTFLMNNIPKNSILYTNAEGTLGTKYTR